MSDPVIVSAEGNVGIIELARPEKFNCLSLEVHERISAARAEFEANPAIRAILIRAQGKHFCTGADLVEVSPPFDQSGNTAYLAASILFELLCVMATSHSGKS